MNVYTSEFLHNLSQRGFIHQVSDGAALDALLKAGSVTGYIGFDATAKSLHVGNLLGIMMLHWFQQAGHRPIVLVGGGTTRVGDPSGKDQARQLLSEDRIEENKAGIRKVFDRFLDFGEGPKDAVLVDNAEWLLKLNYIEFLRDVGGHLSVNAMLARDSVKMRLEREQHLSFLEFNYMVLQAYDFVELGRRYDCRLQMGGSDQWGNIVSGVDLGRRMGSKDLFGLTCPLLTNAAGNKMGKTADGAMWLNSDMLEPYLYWQFWRNCDDADVGRFLKLFTLTPLPEIERLETLQGAERNEAKKVLATEATALVHGREAAEKAAMTAQQTFEQGASAEGLPTVTLPRSTLEEGIGLLALLVHAGLAGSNSDARRHVKGGAVRVNGDPVTDEKRMMGSNDCSDNGAIKLSVGKKRHVLVEPV